LDFLETPFHAVGGDYQFIAGKIQLVGEFELLIGERPEINRERIETGDVDFFPEGLDVAFESQD